MMTTDQIDENETPLDPTLEKVRRKMIRLLLVSIGIMVAGLMAVLAAIVYKANQPTQITTPTAENSAHSATPVEATVELPSGFKVTSTALSGNRILFFGEDAGGKRKAYIFDITSSSLVADVTVGKQ